MNSLVWFKKDLRVQDHPALSHAAQLGSVLPLYIVEPEYWQQPDTSARQWAFTAESLEGLRSDLAQLGAPLIVRVGAACDILERLCQAHKIKHIFSHEETGNLWTYARDKKVAAWARAAGIAWHQLAQSGVTRGAGFGKAQAAFAFAPQALAPDHIRPISGLSEGPIPTAKALRLAEDPCPHRQSGGRETALLLMDGFLGTRGQNYPRAMSSPLSAERGCSRLSPYLALGVLSGREVTQAADLRQKTPRDRQWSRALTAFQSRLYWRDHFTQKLENNPEIERICLNRAAESLRQRESDAQRLNAWATGETGFPFVDACMRYLNATGWLNFRMRAMVMSVASYHLWLDWRATGAILARRFTDYDPGIHWPQVQMQSGTTKHNIPRIYNPIKQGLDQDPSGIFTRRWLPELATVPDAFLHEPWKWQGRRTLLGRRYPEPLVDVMSAHRAAKDAIGGLYLPAKRKETIALIDEEGAKRPQKSAAKQTAQFCFDL